MKHFDITDVFLHQTRLNVCEHTAKTVACLYHVFTFIYSPLIEKDICDCQNVLIKLPRACVCVFPGDILIFSVFIHIFVMTILLVFLMVHFR